MKNLGKCYDNSSIMPWLLTSKSFQIHYQPASLPLHFFFKSKYRKILNYYTKLIEQKWKPQIFSFPLGETVNTTRINLWKWLQYLVFQEKKTHYWVTSTYQPATPLPLAGRRPRWYLKNKTSVMILGEELITAYTC